MGVWLTGAKAALGIFVVLGVFGTHGVARSNGFFDLVEASPKGYRPKLPGSSVDMKLDWTGFKQVDELMGVLLTVFTPMFDGQSAGLATISFHFFAQLYAIWAIILIEGYRVGNAWKTISFVTIFGLIAENVAAAITFPAWCALQLILSPTVKSSSSPALRQKAILVHPTELAILPWSIFLGAVLPVILAVALPFEARGTSFFANAQFWVLLRQFHPAITAVFQIILSALTSAWAPQYKTANERNKGVARALRNVYSIVKYTCIASHVGTLALVVGSQHQPGLFTTEAVAALEPVKMWSAPMFWKDEVARVVTAGDGLWTFLQWDEPVMTLSFLTWAFAINRDALSNHPDGSSFLSAIVRTAGMTLLGGPTAAAASLMEERDEVLLEANDAHEKKA